MIKCKLCGAQWLQWHNCEKLYHPTNDCPLSKMNAKPKRVESINAAIEAVRVDKRDRKLCENYSVQESTGKVLCKKLKATIGEMCPCAAYKKKLMDAEIEFIKHQVTCPICSQNKRLASGLCHEGLELLKQATLEIFGANEEKS